MNLANDAVFLALLSFATTFAVWLIEKIPGEFTTVHRPLIAQIIGAVMGFVYSFPQVYEFMNRAPLPEGATPALYIIGGWCAGLAAIGVHQVGKQSGIFKPAPLIDDTE